MYAALIGLFLLSGFIAYLGDLLGRRMGKKRLSLFGMRPRSTAILMTIITGVIISAVAFGLFFTISNDFRKVFLEGEELLSQNKHLSGENIKLEKINDNLSKRSASLINELKKLQTEVTSAKLNEKAATINYEKAKSSVSTLKKEITRRQNELSSLKKQSNVTKREIVQKEKELSKIRTEYTKAQETLKAERIRLLTATATLVETERQFNEKSKELNDVIAERQSVLEQLKNVNEQLVLKEQALEKAKSIANEMSFESALQRSKPFVFMQGDELARTVIPAGLSPFEIRAKIHDLRKLSSENAIGRGVNVPSNTSAATFVYRESTTEKNYSILIVNQEDAIVNMITSAILSRRTDVMVQTIAAVNTFSNEPVPVELKLYINNTIYKPGDIIATTKIDGKLTSSEILIKIIDFMQNQVLSAAENDGVIPISGKEGTIDFSTISKEDVTILLSLVDLIKQLDTSINKTEYDRNKIILNAVCYREIHVSDTINLTDMRIEIAPER